MNSIVLCEHQKLHCGNVSTLWTVNNVSAGQRESGEGVRVALMYGTKQLCLV